MLNNTSINSKTNFLSHFVCNPSQREKLWSVKNAKLETWPFSFPVSPFAHGPPQHHGGPVWWSRRPLAARSPRYHDGGGDSVAQPSLRFPPQRGTGDGPRLCEAVPGRLPFGGGPQDEAGQRRYIARPQGYLRQCRGLLRMCGGQQGLRHVQGWLPVRQKQPPPPAVRNPHLLRI